MTVMSVFPAFRKEDAEHRISVGKDDRSLVLTPVKPCDKDDDDDDTIRSVCVRKGCFAVEPTKVKDQSHHWFKYTAEGNDGEAKPFFVLVNKASLSALSHDMQLRRFDPDNMNDYLMWTMLGGKLCVVKSKRLDLDPDDKHSGVAFGSNGDYPDGSNFSAAVGDGRANRTNPYPYGYNDDKPFIVAVGDGPSKHPKEYRNKSYLYGKYPAPDYFNGDKHYSAALGSNGDYPDGSNFSVVVGDGRANRTNPYPYGYNDDKPFIVAVGDGPSKHPKEYPDKSYLYGKYPAPDYFNGDKHYGAAFGSNDDFNGDGRAILGPAKHPDGEPWERIKKRIELTGIFNGGKD